MSHALDAQRLARQFAGWAVSSQLVNENQQRGVLVQMRRDDCQHCRGRHQIKAIVFRDSDVNNALYALHVAVNEHNRHWSQ